MPAYEKPQKGNPHQLTVNQHCFPRSCIARFCDSSGTVAVRRLAAGDVFRAKPEAKIFCALRSWDQRAETGFMLDVERGYNEFADRIIHSGNLHVSVADSDLVSGMYCLWSLRILFRDSPVGDQKVRGILGPSVEYSKDQIERLEKEGISTIRPDCSIPGRQIAGMVLQLKFDREQQKLRGTKWFLKRSKSEEFVVPDKSLNRMVIPLTPELCFYHESERGIAQGAIDVTGMNRLAIAGCAEYYFARSTPTLAA